MKKFDFPKKSAENGEKVKNTKTFRIGAASSLLTIFAIVAVLLINLVVRAIPAQYTELDVSASRLFELSDTTLELLDGLDQDVTIYYLCQTGSENDIIVNMLNRYAGASSHVKWEQKDPAVYPTFANQYGAETASMGSTVVVCGDTYKVIDATDYYNYDYDYNYGQFKATSLDAENQFSSAIQYVTSKTGEFPKIYQLTGHGETSLYGSLTAAMNTQNMEVEELGLLSVSEIPEDADTIVINSPTVDYTEADIAIVRDYLEQGGSLLVTTNARVSTPNLEALLAEYGMTGIEGLVVEGDSSHHMRGYAHYLMPTITSTDVTQDIAEGTYLMVPFARGIQLNNELENVKVTALLDTSDSAYNKAQGVNATTTEKEDGDTDGPFTLAAQSVKTLDDDTQAKIIWINSGDMLAADADTMVSGANGTFALGCVTWLTDAESTVLVGAKSLETEILVFTGGQIATMGLTFIVVIPLVILVAGAVVVIRRRAR